MHNSEGWNRQYERMIRWNKRLIKFNDSIPSVDILHDFLDTFYVTCQNVFHLKDWLIKDNIIDRYILNEFISQSNEMGLCRDIANGKSILRLTKTLVLEKTSFDWLCGILYILINIFGKEK